MISKEFATKYFMTSITVKRTTQRDVKRDLATKIVYIAPKNDKFDICFRKKVLFEDYY